MKNRKSNLLENTKKLVNKEMQNIKGGDNSPASNLGTAAANAALGSKPNSNTNAPYSQSVSNLEDL